MEPRDRASLRSTVGATGLVVILVTGFALVPRAFAGREAAMVGAEAPDFHLALVANAKALGTEKTTLSLRELRGRAVLLDFWATWCAACRAETPIINELSRRWSDRGVVVVGVATDAQGEGDPRNFAATHDLGYPIVRDISGETSRTYQVDALPTLVVVSRAGKVVAVRTGITDDAELERLLRQAL
jgi:cytochrome c biogenesis protein CcmG, thiol:disulfide interchange protein DsbE